MAKILQRTKIKKYYAGDSNGPAIIVVDGDPSAGVGTKHAKGSIAVAPDGLYEKSGVTDTDWDKIGLGENNTKGSILKYAAFAVNTQNDDGGWQFSDPLKSGPVRDRTDLSFDNHYGDTAIAIFQAYEYHHDSGILDSIRDALEAWADTPVDPFTRFFPDIVEALIKLGGCPGPLCFDDYIAKGKEAFDAEVNFYKCIEEWHFQGNPANANPPIGNGADGNLLDIWTNNNAAVLAHPIESAAQRMEDRFKLFRPDALRIYDLHYRIRSACLLNDKGETLVDGGAGQSYEDFAKKLANIVKDDVFPNIDPQAFWVTIGTANAVMVFKKFEAEVGFATALTTSINSLKAMLIDDAGSDADGFYAVEDAMNLGTFFSGDKSDQGWSLQALVAAGENEAAIALILNLIAIQDESGHYMDFFDVIGTKQYVGAAAAYIAMGIADAIDNGIL